MHFNMWGTCGSQCVYYIFLVVAGISLQTIAVRRRPNCFNLLHQCEMLMRGGTSSDACEAGLQAKCRDHGLFLIYKYYFMPMHFLYMYFVRPGTPKNSWLRHISWDGLKQQLL